MSPVSGLPGNVYQVQVFVPTAAELAFASGPPGKTFPSLLLLNMVVNGVVSQDGIALSVSQ